jgi:peptide/nickel transport system substrate-binding protein
MFKRIFVIAPGFVCGRACARTFALLFTTLLLLVTCAPGVQPEETSTEVAPTPTEEPAGWSVGDTLRVLNILNKEAPTILNPHLSSSIKDWEPSRITYEPLASFDKDGNLVPFLAAKIPTLENGGVAADGKSVTWKLRQDVRWSDGEPFTADDVLFTYKFVSNPEVKATSAGVYDVIESVEVIDTYTVKINFKTVNPAWALPFVGIKGVILPRHIFEPYNGAKAREAPANILPVGTGPYYVLPPGIKPQEVLLLGTQLVETNKIVFEPNPYFREPDQLFFRRVEMRGGGTVDEAARLVLQDGEVDYAYYLGQLSTEKLAELEAGGRGQLVINFGARVERILLNRTDPNRPTADGERSSLQFAHPFFSDKKVRQAFAHAIDREAIAALYGSTGRPTTNFYEFDLEKAAALLDEVGWVDADGDGIRDKNGAKMKVVFQSPVGAALQGSQRIVKGALESIGVEVELKIVDPAIMFSPGSANPDSAWRFNADMQELAVRSNSPDPSAYMQFWTCDQIPQKANDWSGINFERWCNPEYDALYQQSTTELDPEKRAQLFIQMNDMLIEDVVMIPIVYLADAQGVSRTIEGVDLTPWDANTWNIKDWRRISP